MPRMSNFALDESVFIEKFCANCPDQFYELAFQCCKVFPEERLVLMIFFHVWSCHLNVGQPLNYGECWRLRTRPDSIITRLVIVKGSQLPHRLTAIQKRRVNILCNFIFQAIIWGATQKPERCLYDACSCRETGLKTTQEADKTSKHVISLRTSLNIIHFILTQYMFLLYRNWSNSIIFWILELLY